MKKIIVSSIVATALFGVASFAGASFMKDLSVGSTGADVSALQSWLISKGFSIPAISSGAAQPGYFGQQTKTAVVAYQKSVSLPSTGFVGPLTRGVLNGSAPVAGTPSQFVCPSWMTCTANGTTPPVTTGTPGSITTPGIPGIMTVTAGPLSSSVLNVGASSVAIQTVRVQSQYSDLDVQSITLDLGNNTAIYNKLFNSISVTDGTNVLATQALNGSTVVQSGSEYILGIAGFHVIVPKGTYKDLVIKGTLNPSIDSTYITSGQSHFPGGSGGTAANSINGSSVTGWGIGVVANGLRAVDGAGLNLYGPTTGINQTFTINASLVDNAQANISLDPTSPLVANVPVTDTTNGQYLGLPVMSFGINAQNDSLHLRTVTVGVVSSGTGSVGAAYLYQGSTQVGSASVSGGLAVFNNITNGTPGADIPVNSTKVYTVKVDVTGITSGTLAVTASTTAAQTILSSNDSSVTISGSATGNTQTVAASGPLFTLVGAPTIVKSNITAGNATLSSFQYTATFNVNVLAVGRDVAIGLSASTTGASFGTSTTGVNLAQVYENGVASTTAIAGGLVASYSQPSNTSLVSNSFVVTRNQSVTIPVTYSFVVTNPGAATEAIQLQGINWSGSNSATFMANQPAWRTSAI